jgi:hypothetical protein
MRARGAQATDIAILVVAADDSVMPQTIESINHAKAAGVPIIVAINKIDKPAADPQKVRTALLQHEVFVESMGGEVLDVEVSAKNKINLDKLLDAVLLQAEMLDLQADRPVPPRAWSSKPSLIAVAVPLLPFLSRRARCIRATFSSPVANGAACALWSTTVASMSRKPARQCRSKSSAFRERHRRATGSRLSPTKPRPVKSPSTVSVWRVTRLLHASRVHAVRLS